MLFGLAESGSSGFSFSFPSSFYPFSAFSRLSPSRSLVPSHTTILPFPSFSSPTIDHLDIEQ